MLVTINCSWLICLLYSLVVHSGDLVIYFCFSYKQEQKAKAEAKAAAESAAAAVEPAAAQSWVLCWGTSTPLKGDTTHCRAPSPTTSSL